jgi:hypothetical protein
MKNSNKVMLAGLAAGMGMGYMAAKKQYSNHGKLQKLMNKLEDYLD